MGVFVCFLRVETSHLNMYLELSHWTDFTKLNNLIFIKKKKVIHELVINERLVLTHAEVFMRGARMWLSYDFDSITNIYKRLNLED